MAAKRFVPMIQLTVTIYALAVIAYFFHSVSMKRIFTIYWIWYIITLIIFISELNMPIELAKLIGVSMILNFSYIAFAPIYHLIYYKKSHSSDQRFLNACLVSGIIRSILWCFAFYGLKDHSYILAINAFAMLVFILIESKLKQISKEYFNY